MPGTLYMVATPIGNLEDITLRALRVLREADAIYAEDTRVTRKLLAHYGITKPLFPYYQHSGGKTVERILETIAGGKTIAYVTCAGTPGISDPGPRLVAAALNYRDQIPIVAVPGASAVAAVASLSAVPMDEFHFFGYPPAKKGRRTYFRDVADNSFPGILFESPHRIRKTVRELAETIGSDRRLVIGRELTKAFESIYRGTAEEIDERIGSEKPRGEYVILVEPARKEKRPVVSEREREG